MDIIIEVLTDVLSLDRSVQLSASTRLEDIPDWDSMNAVSVMVQLSKRLGKPLKGLPLTKGMTLGELEAALRGGALPLTSEIGV